MSETSEQPPRASPWEWAFASVSAVLVLAIVGFLLYEATTEGGTPPLLSVQVDTTIASGDHHLVEFWAHNRGGATVAALRVEGSLLQDTAAVETSEATIDFVPSGSKRKAALVFRHDPRRYRLEIRPTGYDIP